jgi:hypothetical protein
VETYLLYRFGSYRRVGKDRARAILLRLAEASGSTPVQSVGERELMLWVQSRLHLAAETKLTERQVVSAFLSWLVSNRHLFTLLGVLGDTLGAGASRLDARVRATKVDLLAEDDLLSHGCGSQSGAGG